MARTIPIALEIGSKRVFAVALDWPGWSRGGRDEPEAIEALVAYAPRYAMAVRRVAPEFEAAADPSAIEIIERLQGGAGTDFGAPGVAPSSDSGSLDEAEAKRLIDLLWAAWQAFDDAAASAIGIELRKGPRGGGRDLERMTAHVADAEQAYLSELGGKTEKMANANPTAVQAAVREVAVRTLRTRALGVVPVAGPRRTRPFWTSRFFVRYSAWHSLDHAWELEDRAVPPRRTSGA